MACMFNKKSKQQQKFIDSEGKAEQRTFDSSSSRGSSAVQLHQDKKRARDEALRNPETKQKLMDYIFGKTTENPLQEINETFNKKSKMLRSKKYDEVHVVSNRLFSEGFSVTEAVNKSRQED